MSGHQEVTYALDFRQSRRENQAGCDGGPLDGKAADDPIPRIARLMALAIRFEGSCEMERFAIMRNCPASEE